MKINESIKQQFFEVLNLKKIYPLYQPIISLKTGEVYGYEALSRIKGENINFNIEEMFQIARQLEKTWEL